MLVLFMRTSGKELAVRAEHVSSVWVDMHGKTILELRDNSQFELAMEPEDVVENVNVALELELRAGACKHA